MKKNDNNPTRKPSAFEDAYTIFGKSDTSGSSLTLRIDIDKTEKNENEAHTVTVFTGRGDISQITEVNLLS